MSEIEVDRGIKLPEHPHLRSLRRRRKEVLRRMIEMEGKRVGDLRCENEVLGKILEDTQNITMEDDDDGDVVENEEEGYG